MSEIEDFHYHMQARNLQPGARATIGKRVWVQDRPLYCPWCEVLFYAYQPEDSPMEPYRQPDRGMRMTCGHPMCHAAEVKRHQGIA